MPSLTTDGHSRTNLSFVDYVIKRSHLQEVVIVMTTRTPRPSTAFGTAYVHESYHGFCVICGSVWPCAAGIDKYQLFVPPVPRALDY